MLPEFARFGPIVLHSYGCLIAAGVLVSLFLMTRAARLAGFPVADRVFDLVFVTVFAGVAGARIFYVVQEWDWYREHPIEILQIWKGGLVYYWGMMASFAGFFLYTKKVRLPFLAAADFTIPYIALTHAFGRIGCFLNGCCFGKPCALPWAVRFPGGIAAVHPVQIYEALFNFGLFVLLRGRYTRRHFAGEITALYLMMYPAGRFVFEFLRGDQPPWLGSLTLHQLLSLAYWGAGFALYGILRRSR